MQTLNEDNRKVVISNVPSNIDVSILELIFENPKYMGQSDEPYEIVSIFEAQYSANGQSRDVIIQYSSEKNAAKILANERIIYDKKNWEFEVKPFVSVLKPTSTEMISDQVEKMMTQTSLSDSVDSENDFVIVDTVQPLDQDPSRLLNKTRIEKEAFRYPYYLLNFNPNLFASLQDLLKSQLGMSVEFKDSNKRIVFEVEASKFDEATFERLVEEFLSHHFASFDMCDQEINPRIWSFVKEETVNYLAKCDPNLNICLMFRDLPMHRKIFRIEGETHLVESVKMKIFAQIEEFKRSSQLTI